MPRQVVRYVPLGDLPRCVWLPEQRGPGGLKTLTLGKKLLVARKLIIQGGELSVYLGDHATRRDTKLTGTISH
jgi:hypothetical protein